MIYARPNASVIYPFLGLDSLLEDLHSGDGGGVGGGGGGGRSLQDFPRILSRVKANAIPCQGRGEERRERERDSISRASRVLELWGLSFSSRKDTRWNYIRSPRDIGRRGEEGEGGGEDTEETDG